MTPPHNIGLALSGGGYRAAAFHLGTLKKLKEMHILENVEVLSTISGGSIIGAYFCSCNKDFEDFEKDMYEGLQKHNAIKGVFFSFMFLKTLFFILIFLVPAIYTLFTPYAWAFPLILVLFFIVLFRFQFSVFPVSNEIEKLYDRFFYHKKKLGDLADKPILVLGSTNLETARPFSFSKHWMQDSTYQYFKDEEDNNFRKPIKFKAANFPLARAVMASSAVPFAFTPISIGKEFFMHPERDYTRIQPQLVDGGVYDNQGIHKIMQQGTYACKIVITSDAGNKLSRKGNCRNMIQVAVRSMDVFMARIKNVQMVQDIYDNTASANKEIAYLSLGWNIENCIPGFVDNLANKNITKAIIDAHSIKKEWVDDPDKYETAIIVHLKEITDYASIDKPTEAEIEIARNVSTNLTGLSKKQVDCLMKQAAALTELQVKLYTPSIVKKS